MAADSSSREAFDFLVGRDDLGRCEFRSVTSAEDVALEPEQALLTVDAFGFTANNITYAVFGDAMRYWSFFPAPAGWGRVPVWGFATVSRSAHSGLVAGERFYGYLPMSSYLIVQAGDVNKSGFTDLASHRSEVDPFYNRYLATAADPGYDCEREAEQMILRPLFFTGFLIVDFLADNGFFEARSVIVSSASSKTSIGLAFNLFAREPARCEVIGLTSRRNVAFVESLGCYHRVVAYDDLGSIPATTASVFVDMAGDAELTTAIHSRLGSALKYNCQVGATHWDRLSFSLELPGPQPVLFWAPGRVAKRMQDWGSEGFQVRTAQAWKSFLPLVDRWMTVERSSGKAALERVYLDTLRGKADPRKGYVVAPG
ncbi:MAG: DUF2855 family protein [Acidobacteriota bacterium]|nr:MAG: DUF2855 family protein [Acidobacteriota bacterium]